MRANRWFWSHWVIGEGQDPKEGNDIHITLGSYPVCRNCKARDLRQDKALKPKYIILSGGR